MEEIKQEENTHVITTIPGKILVGIVGLSILSGITGGFLAVKVYNQDGGKEVATGNDIHQKVVLDEDSAVVNVVKKSSPAVVSILISKDLSKYQQLNQDPFSELNPFAPFFGFGLGQRQSQGVQEIGAGSGFFVSSDGLILTNRHVVSDENASYTVLTTDRKKYEAKVLARDPVNDLAIVKVDIVGAPTLELASSSNLDIGQKVIAIGNSLGQYQNTVTTGIISGIGRSVIAGSLGDAEQLEGVIQTDAAINPGNSGGPLLNILGQVVGINTAIDQQGQLVGFAIPASDARRAVDSFNKNGKITRAYLGVRYTIITSELAATEKLPKDYGALVVRGQSQQDLAVIPGSPADKAGLVENDIILECDGTRIDEDNSLVSCIKKKEIGDIVSLKVYHEGEEKMVPVKLEESK